MRERKKREIEKERVCVCICLFELVTVRELYTLALRNVSTVLFFSGVMQKNEKTVSEGIRHREDRVELYALHK